MDGNNKNNTSISILSPTNMMNTLSLQSDEPFQNNLIEAMNPITALENTAPVKRLSLADITVAEILKTYKHDTDLLKHILAAKTEEDKRKGAEELRRAEEARLQSKYIDLQLEQNRRSSLFDDASLGLSPNNNHNDWLSHVNSTTSNDLLSPSFLNNTPPSPYTLFDASLSTELNLSAPSSPEPNNPTALLVEKISLTDDPPPTPTSNEKSENVPPPSPPPNNKEKASCKRTFSRTRSTRKPSVRVLAKKNRYLQQQNGEGGDEKGVISSKENEKGVQGDEKKKDDSPPLDHDTVMEALRAKLKRSSQQLKEQNNTKEEFTSMSPSGILLLDLKNPKKSFPLRGRATPRVSVVRKPNSFISAHKPKETNVNS